VGVLANKCFFFFLSFLALWSFRVSLSVRAKPEPPQAVFFFVETQIIATLKTCYITALQKRLPPLFARGWEGGQCAKSGGDYRESPFFSSFFFFFLLLLLLGVAGGSNSDLKNTSVMRHFIENAKNGFRRACKALNVK